MPKNRCERRELSHKWEDIRPLLKDSAHITYEVVRPVLLFGISPKERAEETGMSKSSIYYKANLFDRQIWRVSFHQRHHQISQSRISVLSRLLSGKPSSMHMQNIQN